MAIWSLAKRLWPVFAVLGVLLALWAWGNSRFDAGVEQERTAWEDETARLRAVAAEEALKRQLATNAADDAARASGVALDALAAQSRKDAHVYYKDRPVVRCLDPERLRAIAEADRAALAAAGAAK